VISETIATYYEIQDRSLQLNLGRENVQLLGERVEITENRYRRGLVTSFELYTVRQSLDDLRASLPVLESEHYEAKARLALLLGTVTAEVEGLLNATENDLAIPGEIPVGLPSDLLRQRPDIAASAARLESARQRIGVARAERFPSISLTASGGTQSSDLADLVNTSQNFWLFGGSLLAPVFNAGALNAGVRAAWARYEQAAAAYEKTVLTAFKEASSALVEHDAQLERLDAIRETLDSASASADSQLRRYRRGIGDYLALLDARINELRAQTNLSGALRAVIMARLGVHRALAGAWLPDSSDMAVNMHKKEFQQ
jgi:NodT family efflux transporter outer membrane factor (OMF) lipoprotein